MQVLIVDDIPVNRKVLCQMLSTYDYEVIEAEDGHQAIECFQKAHPDLVLMDIRMPGVDGYQAAGTIKELAGQEYTPIIFVTALKPEMALSKALEAGGDDFISKPINLEILNSKIKAHLRIREMSHRLNAENRRLSHEQALIGHFFENTLKQSYLDPTIIRHKISPMTVFNGDLLLAERNPDGGLFVLLGDFTGHGLTAAMGTMPVALVFFAMARKGAALPELAREINHKLRALMPSEMFFAAALLELSADGLTVSAWTGGMPTGYVCSPEGGLKSLIPSRHLPLGILGDDAFDSSTQVLSVEKGDRIYLCTDGLIEACSPEGESFGTERLERLLSGGDADKFTLVLESLAEFRRDEAQHDDISFIELKCDEVPALGNIQN